MARVSDEMRQETARIRADLNRSFERFYETVNPPKDGVARRIYKCAWQNGARTDAEVWRLFLIADGAGFLNEMIEGHGIGLAAMRVIRHSIRWQRYVSHGSHYKAFRERPPRKMVPGDLGLEGWPSS